MKTYKKEDILRIKNIIKNKLEETTGEKYDVNYIEATKTNLGSKDGITIRKSDENIGPIYYLDAFCEDDENNTCVDYIAENIFEAYLNNTNARENDLNDYSSIIKKIGLFEEIKDRIKIRIVNKKMNEKLLSNCPHKSFLDLAAIAYIDLADKCSMEGFSASITVKNNLIEEWKTSFEKVYNVGLDNIKDSYETESLSEILGFDDPLNMIVLSTNTHIHGASALLDKEIFKHISDDRNSDLIILPSSVHELIIINKDKDMNDEDIKCLQNMICSVNNDDGIINPEEILSDHPYFYIRENDEII